MNSDLPGTIDRVKSIWRWQSSRTLLLIAAAITVILSLFDVELDAVAMLRQLASNFITCGSITFITATVAGVADIERFERGWRRSGALLLLLAFGGMLGGLLGWGINSLLFPYHVSHPSIYFLVVSALAVIFGLAVVAYESVSGRLKEAVSRLAAKEVEEQRLRQLKTVAELEALRARVNPHFLFNTLNSIASLIPVDPQKAEEVVQRLSNLFHYVLSAGDRGLVPLAEELAVVVEYLEIEKVRLGSRLVYALDKDESIEGVMIPSMLLQPLVENSVKYGVVPERAGGSVKILCRRDGERCSITIVDTGKGFDRESASEGFGIGGVRQRLELYYPGAHEFAISADAGTTIRIDIPATNEIQDRPR